MKRAHSDPTSWVIDPSGNPVLATADDSTRSKSENDRLYQWQAIPYSMLLNGKEIYIIYLDREIISLDEIMRCEPCTGLVSKKCNYILINDGTDIHALMDPGKKPNALDSHDFWKFWYNQYTEYVSLSIELLQGLKDREVTKLFENGLGRMIHSQLQRNCVGGKRICIRPFKSFSFEASGILGRSEQNFLDSRGIHYFCSLTRTEFNKKMSEMLKLFHHISQILMVHELPREIIYHFISYRDFWNVIPPASERDLESLGAPRFSSFTLH